MLRIDDLELSWHSAAARALEAVGKGTVYRLGRGGFKVRRLWESKESDCSGFVCHCLQLSRMPKLSRPWWINTDSMVKDAKGAQKVFVRLSRPVRGCVVVYPSGTEFAYGHCGIVVKVYGDGLYDVIDCRSTADGDAIQRRSGTVFRKRDAIFVSLR